MNKLIDLLNEWLKYKEKFGPDKLTRVAGIDDSGELLFELKNGCYWHVEYIISKKAEFIKRLVENNKIDYDKCIKEFMLKDFGKFYYMSKDEVVIANLSIQDNPIEFLISILK